MPLRNWEEELKKRTTYIQSCLKEANASAIIFGNSGGKDSCLVGILCKKACDKTISIVMPCESNRNFTLDKNDGENFAKEFNIESHIVDITPAKLSLKSELEKVTKITADASINVNPRLRMTTLYALGRSFNALVAGTGNRSEAYMGYFTKWGDGAYDFNPIADLTVTEIYEFLNFLNAPKAIIEKAPSAGLYDGQTDEGEMGVTYKAIDEYLLYGKGDEKLIEKIEAAHKRSVHKYTLGKCYKG